MLLTNKFGYELKKNYWVDDQIDFFDPTGIHLEWINLNHTKLTSIYNV